MQTAHVRSLVLVLALLLGGHPGIAHAETTGDGSCAKLKSLPGSDCAGLKMEVDFSACETNPQFVGGMIVKSCSPTEALVQFRTTEHRYRIRLKGTPGEGRSAWTLAGVIEKIVRTTEDKKSDAKYLGTEKVSVKEVAKKEEVQAEKTEKPADKTAEKKPEVKAEKKVETKEKNVVAKKREKKASRRPASDSMVETQKSIVSATDGPSPQIAIAPSPTPSPSPSAAPTVAASPRPASVVSPFSNIQLYGDLRLRTERAINAGTALPNDDYQRIRARLGVKAVLAEKVQTELRLATGPGRASTNQTLGTGANAANGPWGGSYSFLLDRASFRWNLTDSLFLAGGRMGNPLYLVGDNDLVWDTDMNFDGTTLRADLKNDRVSVILSGSYYWVDSNTSTQTPKDVVLGVLQAAPKVKVGERSSIAVTADYYWYDHVPGHMVIGGGTTSNGNSFTTSGGNRFYTQEYHLLNTGLEYNFEPFKVPTTVFVDHVQNMEVRDHNEGWMGGVRINRLKKKGDWAVYYDYRVLEKDATIGAFTDGDCYGGGTNGRCHRASAGYQLYTGFSMQLSTFFARTGIAPGENSQRRNKFQLDFNVNF